VIHGVPSALAARRRRHLERPRRAAVLVPVIDDGGPLRLLLTRRTEALATHKGHVAFPGGMADPGDVDAVDTALREAEEEIALPRSAVEILGVLDDFPTVTDGVAVTPVVGRILRLPPLIPQPEEVARIFTIPFDVLRRPDGWEVKQYTRGDVTWPVYFFPYDGETLWGLSAYIALHLLDAGGLGAPFPLPEPGIR
jgi:8-oxo-dGTP pyrophosphatase MutT (NUDIX family)